MRNLAHLGTHRDNIVNDDILTELFKNQFGIQIKFNYCLFEPVLLKFILNTETLKIKTFRCHHRSPLSVNKE